MNTKTVLTVSALGALLSTPVLAKGHPDPKLPKEVQAIHCLVGDWTMREGQFTVGGQKHKAQLALSCAPTSNGFGVLCRARFDIEGLGKGLEETDLFGYDPGQNRYHWFSVTQMGETHDHVAVPPGDNDATVAFAYSGLQDGQPMQEIIHMTMAPDGKKIDFRNDGVVGGQQAWLMTGTMVKK